LTETVLEENSKVENFLKETIPKYATSVLEDEKDWTTFVYGSKYGEANDGEEKVLVYELSRLNPVIQSLRASTYVNIYQGFELKEIYNRYPGVNYETTSYTPIVREWYFRAAESPKETILTEPYIDPLTNTWVFSTSIAIKNSTKDVIGVAGADITLKSITEKITHISLLDGYEILVTEAGMILTKPASWNIEETARIYDTSETGFSYELWEKVLKSTPGDSFDFQDLNGTDYFMVVDHISPFQYSSNVTHFVLLFVNKQKVKKPVDDLDHQFRNINEIMFWVVISITSGVIVISFFLIYFQVKSTIAQLRTIEKLFRNIIRRSLFTRATRDVNLRKLDFRKSGIEELAEGCKYKVKKISGLEEKFNYFKWGLTRPKDAHIYSTWTNNVFPFNKHYGKKIDWREKLKMLEKPTLK
jgi:hypothetical protein